MSRYAWILLVGPRDKFHIQIELVSRGYGVGHRHALVLVLIPSDGKRDSGLVGEPHLLRPLANVHWPIAERAEQHVDVLYSGDTVPIDISNRIYAIG